MKLIEAKLITAILPKGKSLEVVKKLREEKAINTAGFNFARGTGKLTPLKYSGGVVEREKEILTVIVEAAQRGNFRVRLRACRREPAARRPDVHAFAAAQYKLHAARFIGRIVSILLTARRRAHSM